MLSNNIPRYAYWLRIDTLQNLRNLNVIIALPSIKYAWGEWQACAT